MEEDRIEATEGKWARVAQRHPFNRSRPLAPAPPPWGMRSVWRAVSRPRWADLIRVRIISAGFRASRSGHASWLASKPGDR
jgi:hypothetical protein